MITINSNEEALALIKDGVLAVNDDIEITFDGFKINADIKCKNIYSKDRARGIDACNIDANDINARNINADDIDACNIDANDIKACNINAHDINADDINADDIKACDIDACDINADDIKAWNINARNINADDIKAWNINTRNINAKNISYFAICVAYGNINCTSIKGRRHNSKHFCLDGKITIIEEQNHENISTT